ncbi:MAG: sulfatase-like hydrolase/transferase [Erythrobacter sp.]|nr:sulfatase-like hydrolase/transferase [Erythrobacter sp.]
MTGAAWGANRRRFLQGTTAASLSAMAGFPAQALGTRRPNILFVLADDLRWDGVGFLNGLVETPNLDRLAGQGVVFDSCFVTTSICCTSRASIQTGTFARRHQVWDFDTRLGADLQAQTYPRLLRQSGYRTGYFGKYGIADGGPDGSHDPYPALLEDFDEIASFDDYYGETDVERREHHSLRVGGFAEAFLRRQDERPFCLSLGFKAPHAKDNGDPVMGPYVAEPDMLAEYSHTDFVPTETMTEAAFDALPPFLQRSEARRRWQQRFSTPELWQDSVRKYFALVSGIDRQLGRLLNVLEETGQWQDTLVIFTSDNGYLLGDYGLEGKWFGFEGSIRIPLVMAGAGIARTGRVAAPVLNVDFAPTMLAMAGLAAPPTMQGRDLSPFLAGAATPAGWRSDFLYEHYLPGLYHYSRGMESFLPSSEGVRGERYTYIRYPRQPDDNEMLFDRLADPDEMNDISETADPALLQAMRHRADQLIAEAGGAA